MGLKLALTGLVLITLCFLLRGFGDDDMKKNNWLLVFIVIGCFFCGSLLVIVGSLMAIWGL